jgi:hypothetical protein
MSLDIHFWNIIVPKKTLESKYPGGSKQFKLNCPNKMFQEDEFLASYSFVNVHDVEFHVNKLTQMGLAYDEKSDSSEEFVVLAMEANGGLWWKVDWIDYDSDYFWFKENNPQNLSGKNPTHNSGDKLNSQIALLNELKKSVEIIGQYTYKNFLVAFKLNEKDYRDATLFEATMSALFLLDYIVSSKDVTKEFRDNLYHLCSTKILNEFSNKLRNKNLMEIIKSRYSSYAEIPGIRKERWQQSFHNLLEVNLKGTKSLDNVKIIYPTTLDDFVEEMPLKMEFIEFEIENSYRTVSLVNELFLGKSLENSLLIIKSIENKNPQENNKLHSQFIDDRDSFLESLITLYGKPLTNTDKRIGFRWIGGPFYYPSNPSVEFEDTDEVIFSYIDDMPHEMNLMITWSWHKGKELVVLENYPAIIGRVAKKALYERPSGIKKVNREENWFFEYGDEVKTIVYSLSFKRAFFQKELLCNSISFFQSYNTAQ